MVEWSDLRIFLAVAREGTLRAAARKLGQTQPTMGRRVRALEAAVGHTLFQRTAGGFVMTAEAASVLANAERVEKEVLAFERRLAGREAQLEGTLRLSATDWFGTLLLAPALAEFGRQHPSVAFELLTDARHYSLSRREADMVFRSRRFDEPEVVARRLMHIPFALYGVPGSDKTVLGDGTGARMITMDAIVPDLPDATWRRQYLPRSVVACQCNNRLLQARLCSEGAGLAVLPRPLGNATSNVVALEVNDPPPGRDIFVGYHRDLRRLKRLRMLLELVVARCAS